MNAESKSSLTPAEWRTLLETIGDKLSAEEKSIVEMLARETTQVEIAKQMGLHPSTVWRRVKAIAKRSADQQLETTDSPSSA